jgi:hypothetical protein
LRPVIYFIQVSEKVFVANITVQVIERHIVRGLEYIFFPITVSQLLDAEILSVAAEPDSTKKEREALTEKVRILTEGQLILSELMSSISC